MDIRVAKHARIIVDYSLKVKKDESVVIRSNTLASPLVGELHKQIILKGAYPVPRLTLPGMNYQLMKYSTTRQLKKLYKPQLYEAKYADKFVSIFSDSNTREMTGVDPSKMAISRKTLHPVQETIMKKNWTLTLHPTESLAQDAEMSLEEFEDFVYKATLIDWKKLSRNQEKLISKIEGGKKIRIVARDTDISMSINGRTFVNSDGRYNMPSGEIFTGPVEKSVNGHIKYSFPAIYGGREVDGIRLEFKNGMVVKAVAGKNNEYLHKMIEMDKGSGYVGELGLGNNYSIKKFVKNILFDEKIGGTIHLALGASYPETGGKNKSALHWDMICDLRKNGCIYLDGKVIQQNGKWLI